MITAIYRPITIKSKADAEKFVNSFGGEAYLSTDDTDFTIEKDKHGRFIACARSVSERGNIFSPYFQVSKDPVDWCWKHRKMLNRWMNDETV